MMRCHMLAFRLRSLLISSRYIDVEYPVFLVYLFITARDESFNVVGENACRSRQHTVNVLEALLIGIRSI